MIKLELETKKQQAQYFINRDFKQIPFDIIDEEDWYYDAQILEPKDEELFDRLGISPNLDVWNNFYLLENSGDYYTDSEYCNVDKLYELGFIPVKYKDYIFVHIQGYGYDVIDEHFIPLFEHLKWLK